jgi:hypothetical protein
LLLNSFILILFIKKKNAQDEELMAALRNPAVMAMAQQVP